MSRDLKIGDVTLRGRALLAPLSGVTDRVLRRIAARWGATAAVTEMVASESLLRRDAEARLRAEAAGAGIHVVQLVGRDPYAMGEAARIVEAAGADIIDINFGCPAKKVTGGLAGSALMREPGRALAIVAAVVGAVRRPVTVKMRLGWDAATGNAAELSHACVGEGVAAVTVHGRTRQKFYEGRADWGAIRAVAAAIDRPVVANGDIATLADARDCLDRSGAAAIMIGRAAIGQPWLVGVIAAQLAGRPARQPDAAERTDIAREHYEGLLGIYGRETGIRHARKHLAAYAERAVVDGYAVCDADRALLVRSSDTAAVAGALGRLYRDPDHRRAA